MDNAIAETVTKNLGKFASSAQSQNLHDYNFPHATNKEKDDTDWKSST